MLNRCRRALVVPVVAALVGLAACGGAPGDDDAPDGRVGQGGASSGELTLVSSDVARDDGERGAVPDAVASLHHLAGSLYGELATSEGNLALSPYSIAVALAMTANGANGTTAEEMLEVLGTDDLGSLNEGLNALSQYVEGLAGDQERADGSEAELALATANQLFGHHQTVWNDDFLETLARHYGAGMRTVDYVEAAEDARLLINAWTSEQ
ncbi:serpin family protein, partial [Nocardioides sp.]|uniref:serpin family protein n=1 Tax=Nocardioides sp. TaxID=35761 RepID=UPI00273417CF